MPCRYSILFLRRKKSKVDTIAYTKEVDNAMPATGGLINLINMKLNRMICQFITII